MERLLTIDRRVIFIFVFLGVAIPLLMNFTLPISVSKEVQAAYDEVERVAQDREPVVLLSFSYGASTKPEMQPMARAILRHCFQRNIKVVAVCLFPDAVGLAQEVLHTTAHEFGKMYGEDYAFMGYKPGTFSVVINMGQSFHDAFPKDNRGTSSGEIPLTSSIATLKDREFTY